LLSLKGDDAHRRNKAIALEKYNTFWFLRKPITNWESAAPIVSLSPGPYPGVLMISRNQIEEKSKNGIKV